MHRLHRARVLHGAASDILAEDRFRSETVNT